MSTQNREAGKAGRKPRLRGVSRGSRRPVKRAGVAFLVPRGAITRALELALLGDPLVRLGRALDAILLLIAFLVGSSRTT